MGVRVRQKVKGGPWWVFVAHRGRRTSKQVGARKAALDLAKTLEAELAKQDFRLPSADIPTFARVAQAWLARYPLLRSLRQTSVENHERFLRAHLLPFFGSTPVSDITSRLVEDFIAAKRSPGGSVRFTHRPLSPASLRVGLKTLRAILQRAVLDDYLSRNPVTDLGRLLPRKAEDAGVDPFTGGELRAILMAAERLDPGFATLVRLWVQSGLRAGEVLGLQERDLDMLHGTVTVRRTWTRGRLGPTKTGHVRTVSILHPVCEATAAWHPGATPETRSLLARVRARRVQSIEPEGFVFGGVAPLHPDAVNRRWKRLLRVAQVRYRPAEQLRHTFASTLLSRNAPVLYVQQQGGWRSAAVLLQVYARWLPTAVIEHPGAPQVRLDTPRSGDTPVGTGTYGAGLNFQK